MDIRSLFSFVNLLLFVELVIGRKDLPCPVCRALVDEIKYEISTVDPKKTIQVGSYRIDSRGNTGTYEKPYSQSEVYLTELFENICTNLQDYAESTDEAGKASIARIKVRDGRKALSLKNVKISADIGTYLKHQCNKLVEDYEEEMIQLFIKADATDQEKQICVGITGKCREEELAVPLPIAEAEYEPEDKDTSSDTSSDTVGDTSSDTVGDTSSDDSNNEKRDEINQFIKDNIGDDRNIDQKAIDDFIKMEAMRKEAEKDKQDHEEL